jgi:hypothetical protein
LCTPELAKRIGDSISLGLPNKDAAILNGIDEGSFYNWMLRGEKEYNRLIAHPRAKPKEREAPFLEFFKYIKGAIPRRKSSLLSRIHAASADSRTWQAAAWLLERLHPDEFALKTRQEHTGAGGGPIQTSAATVTLYIPQNGRDDTATPPVEGNGDDVH